MKNSPTKILVVDDERASRTVIGRHLAGEGFEVIQARNGADAAERLYDGISLVVSDLKMPDLDGLELLKLVRSKVPHVAFIMLTGSGSIETAIESLRIGASDYLLKPVNLQELVVKIKRAIAQREMNHEIAELHAKLKGNDEIYQMIGRCQPMRNLFERIRLVASTDATVLITGESGTGKELVAKAIHAHSARAKQALFPFNFAAASEGLIESELFGHESGIFTRADKRRDGVFHSANAGTLFLDEIGEMPMSLQSKLLRVLENRSVRRVKSQHEDTIDVRIIAATHCDLRRQVDQGRFREDLFYRLNVVNIALPPLRDRVEDIPLLAQSFANSIAVKTGRLPIDITTDAMDCLRSYSWPGNVRELRNTLENIIVLSLKDRIEFTDLPPLIRGDVVKNVVVRPGVALRDLEYEAIRRTLESLHGHRKKTAKSLGISVRTLQRKIKNFNLDPKPDLEPIK